MRKPIIIGERVFAIKKDALAHYKLILNAYEFGQSLNDADFDDLLGLLNYGFSNMPSEAENFVQDLEQPQLVLGLEPKQVQDKEVFIEDIKVSKVQYGAKCFEVFYDDKSSQYISYLMIIKGWVYTPEKLFSTACRNSIQKDLMTVKQDFFKKNALCGLVKCQETGQLSNWNEVVVDHRQPHTLSIIIDRFKELNRIDIDKIEYANSSDNIILFNDIELTRKFVHYHQQKAILRVVRRECNASRTAMARIKRSSKDLSIRQNNQFPLL